MIYLPQQAKRKPRISFLIYCTWGAERFAHSAERCISVHWDQDKVSIYGWARFQSMRETSSVMNWEIAWPYYKGDLYASALPWWRHQMETFSALLAICAGNSPVTGEFPSQSQWRGALMFSLICAWINGWANNREAGDLRRHRAHYDVIVMASLVLEG